MPEPSLSEPTRSLKQRFIFALASVALLSVFGQLLIQGALQRSLDDAHILNLSGRQRMLSQRLCKVALLLHFMTDDARRNEWADEMRVTLAQWSAVHDALRAMVPRLGLPPQSSTALEQLFSKAEPHLRAMLAAGRVFVSDGAEGRRAALAALLERESRFLAAMEAIVERFEIESSRQIGNISRDEFGVLGWLLFVLLLQGFLVFWPVVRRIDRSVLALGQREREMTAILEAVPDSVVLLRRDGTLAGQFAARSESQACALPPESLDSHVREAVQRAISRHEIVCVDSAASGPDERRCEIRLSRYDDETALALIRDVTLQRQIERRLLDLHAAHEQRLGADLHDGLCQELTGVLMVAESIEGRVRKAQDLDLQAVTQLREHLATAVKEARRLSRSMYPGALEAHGLIGALESLCSSTAAQSGITCRFTAEMDERVPVRAVEIHMYRIAQEAIANALRHGRPAEIRVSLRAERPTLELCVSDDGTGINEQQATTGGVGLFSMNSRALAIGARLTVRRGAPGGTVVRCVLPLDPNTIDARRGDADHHDHKEGPRL